MSQHDTPEAVRLANEYRTSMTAEVLHSWAVEAAALLRRIPELEAERDRLSAEQAAQGAGEVVGWWKRYPDGSVSIVEAKTFIAEDALSTGWRPLTYAYTAQPAPVVPEGWIDGVLREVAELPDRTSPEDEPDMMLVTADELRSILLAATPTPPAQAAAQPVQGVPEATEEMLVAGLKECEPLGELIDWREGFGRDEMRAVWNAMLTASPTPPAQQGGDVVRDALLIESARWDGSDHRLAVWEALRVFGSRVGVTVTREDQHAAIDSAIKAGGGVK